MGIKHSRYDTIIVGARAAGAATALLLARAGQRVLLIDRGSPDDDTISTHALMRPAVHLLHRWGVLDTLRAANTPAIRRSTFYYGDEAVPVDIKPRDGVDALYAPRRTVLDPALVAAARAAGAEVHHHTRMRGLLRQTGRVTGVVLEAAGETRWIEASLVVGADGIGSAVARHLDAPVKMAGEHATATLYAHVAAVVDGYHWYFRPGSSAGLIGTNGGTTAFIVIPAERYRSEVRHDRDAAFVRIASQHIPAASRLLRAGPVLHAFGGRRGTLRRATGPGWALVGDAGFYRDPLTAHGLTDALRDAALLAHHVRAGADLAAYETARDALAVPMLRVSDALASFAWSLDELRGLHRELQQILALEYDVVRELADTLDVQRPLGPAPSAREAQHA